MVRKCTDPGHNGYNSYGAIGVSVCEEWIDSFESFFFDMGKKPNGLSLILKDESKSFSRDNCDWGKPTSYVRKLYTAERAVWGAMIRRCTDPLAARYSRYGGRGIVVCERWMSSFDDFLLDVGARPTCDHSIDRISNDGNYEPGNVRWSTREQQSRNKGCTRFAEHNGERRSLAEWSEILDIDYHLLHGRLRSGLTLTESISKPKRKSVRISYNGETLNISQWATRLGVKPSLLYDRLSKGWSTDRVLFFKKYQGQ
jgi:hypothetical protein